MCVHYIVCVCSLRYPAWNVRAPYSKCVAVALGIQHTIHMHHIVICCLPAIQYFPNYLINGIIFEIKLLSKKKCVLIFCTNFVQNISHSKKKWEIYDKNIYWFYICGSEYRKIFITSNQRDADLIILIYYLLRDHSTCFWCSLHPLLGSQKTVVTTTGTSHVYTIPL